MKTLVHNLPLLSTLLCAASLHAQTVVLSEGFERAFPGAWSVGDDNPSGPSAYWQDVNVAFGGEAPHGGNWKGYCAGNGFAGDATNPTYRDNMSAYMSRTIDLRGFDSATLTFWSKMPSIESCCDKARVIISAIDSTTLWSSSDIAGEWTRVTIDLSPYVGLSPTLKFQFDSDSSVNAEGWYLDDIQVTGFVVPPNDACTDAIALQDNVPYSVNTTAATSNDRIPSCQSGFGKGVWFTFTPNRGGTIEVSTCGSDFDTVLQVYSGVLCRILTEVPGGCNDDDGPACAGRQASLRLTGTAGVPYTIMVGGYGGAAGNLRIVARWVDDVPPQITCPANLVLDTDPGQCSSANVTYAPTASDNVGVVSLVCTPPSGSTFPKGVTTVQCVAADAAGNTNACAFTVTVRDVGWPQVNCPSNLVVATEGESARVEFVVTAVDNCDPAPIVTCEPPSGSVFPLGTTTVRCTASDSSANTIGCRFTVTVNRLTHAPTITAQPSSATAFTGDPVRFQVVADGTPPLDYQWFFNGQAMPDATNHTYLIERTLPSHAGEYVVRVSSPFGEANSQPAVLTLQLTNKVDRWTSEAIQTALGTSVYADLRMALEAQGYRAQVWKAQVRWGFDALRKDPYPICQVATVPFQSPAGSDRVATVGVLLGIPTYEDRLLIAPPPLLGGVALIADVQGGQRSVLRILCDSEGVCRPLEVLDDECLAEWFHPMTAPPEAPTYTAIIADLVQSGVDCGALIGTGRDDPDGACPRFARSMGLFTYCVMSICLPPGFEQVIAPAAGSPVVSTSSGASEVQAAGGIPPVDGRRTCCGWDWKRDGAIGGAAGGLVGTVAAVVFALDDDEGQWCIDPANQYAVLEGTVGQKYGRVWQGNAGGLPTHFSSTDNPFIHDSLDWIIKVAPFDAGQAWPGSPHYLNLASQFNSVDGGQRMIECEWESKYVPDFIRTWPGDRIWMRGQFIFDCGHETEKGGASGYRSEIHPPHALVTMRQEGAPLTRDGMVMPARVARVYITPWAGEANHPDNINSDGRVWSSGATMVPRFDAAHTPYQFKVPLPSRPLRCDLTPGTAPAIAVRIEPAAGLAWPTTSSTDGGGMRITRQQSSQSYLQNVLSSVVVSLWPDTKDPSHLLVKVPLTDGPIPDLGGGISPIQFKISTGWYDAALALQVSAAMPVLDGIEGTEIPAEASPVIISAGHPLASGRGLVPPDRRTKLRVTGPDCAWQVQPVRVDFTEIQVHDDHDDITAGDFHVHVGANGEWRFLPGLDDNDASSGHDYPVNVSVPVSAWDGSDTRLEIGVVGFDQDEMDWGVQEDEQLGRIFNRYQGALGVDQSPYLSVLSDTGDFGMDYRIVSDEATCAADALDPANDRPETATGIAAPGTRAYTNLRVGPLDTADWFTLDTDDYMTLTATLTDQTAQSANRCRTYRLQVVTERAVIPPDRFDDGIVGTTPCGAPGGPLKVQEFAGRNDDGWTTSPILYLCPAAVTEADFDCNPVAPMRDFFPDNLWLDTLNFHLPYPGIDSTPDKDFFRIQIPNMQEICDAPCPAILNGKFAPAALVILIESDRDRPVMVTITNFTTGFVLDNDPATPAPAASETDGRKFEISRNGTQTLIQLECPYGSGWFPDRLLGLALSDPDGQRNFYNLRASYQAIASCDISKLLVSPGMMELILGGLHGAIDPIDLRFLPMMTLADPANALVIRGQSMPFMDEPGTSGAWSGDDRWLVLLPRGQTSMDITVEAPAGAGAFDVGIELRNLQDQPIAQAGEVGNTLNRALGKGGVGDVQAADSPTAPKHYRLQTGQLDGCFYFLKVTRPMAGGRFTLNATFTKSPEIAVTPATSSFGNRCLGTPIPAQWVTLNNTGTASLMVSNLSLAGPDAVEFALANVPALPAEIPPGANLSFAVSFQPTRVGPSLAEVVIASNDATDPVVRMPVKGTGQEGDLEPPQLNCPPDLVVWTCSNGATVNYTVSASDDCDPNLEVVCLPPSGSWFGLGTNQVRCFVTDSTGRSNECVFAVQVLSDTEPPAILCPSNRVVNCMGTNGTLVFYQVETTDNAGGAITVKCNPPPGTWFPPGETLVTCEAVDACGNRAQCTFPVIVRAADPVPLSIIAEGGLVHISWPFACAAYRLQTATSLSVPIQWTPSAETPVATGDGYTATVRVTTSTRFFRLQQLK